MKNLRLSDLKNKSNKWFRDYGVIHPKNNTSLEALRYMAKRSFEALPPKLRKYLEDEKARIIDTTAHAVLVDGENGQWDMYESMLARAKDEYKTSGDQTAEFIYKEFRLQEPALYSKYNSYVYRLGQSASKWFISHFNYTSQCYYLYAEIELPIKTKGKTYSVLEITFRWDAHDSGLIEIAQMI